MRLILVRATQIGSRYSLAPFVGSQAIFSRTIFTKEELGVIRFEQLRKNALVNFKSPADVDVYKKNFLENYTEQFIDEKRNKLKEFILLTNCQPNDLMVLKKCLADYHEDYNKSVHNVTDFCFGTQVMRLFYILNLPEEAINFYKDAGTKCMFEQMQTYKVMLSLLYENKRYSDVFELYKEIRKRIDLRGLFPDITINCLAFAACYHLNTPEHFKYAEDLWHKTRQIKQLQRSKQFLAALALKQKKPIVALNLTPEKNLYVTVRFIQLEAYLQLDKIDEAFEIVQRTIQAYKLNSKQNKPTFGNSMIDNLRVTVEKSGTDQHIKKFEQLYAELQKLDLINEHETLDHHLCKPFPPMLPKNVFLKMKNKTVKTN